MDWSMYTMDPSCAGLGIVPSTLLFEDGGPSGGQAEGPGTIIGNGAPNGDPPTGTAANALAPPCRLLNVPKAKGDALCAVLMDANGSSEAFDAFSLNGLALSADALPALASNGLVAAVVMDPNGLEVAGLLELNALAVMLAPKAIVGGPALAPNGLEAPAVLGPKGLAAAPVLGPKGFVVSPVLAPNGAVPCPVLVPNGLVLDPLLDPNGLVAGPAVAPNGLVLVPNGLVLGPGLAPNGFAPNGLAVAPGLDPNGLLAAPNALAGAPEGLDAKALPEVAPNGLVAPPVPPNGLVLLELEPNGLLEAPNVLEGVEPLPPAKGELLPNEDAPDDAKGLLLLLECPNVL